MWTHVLFVAAMSSQLGWDCEFFTTVSACFVLDDLNGPFLFWRRLTFFGDKADLGKRDVSDSVIFWLLEAEFLVWDLSPFYDL